MIAETRPATVTINCETFESLAQAITSWRSHLDDRTTSARYSATLQLEIPADLDLDAMRDQLRKVEGFELLADAELTAGVQLSPQAEAAYARSRAQGDPQAVAWTHAYFASPHKTGEQAAADADAAARAYDNAQRDPALPNLLAITIAPAVRAAQLPACSALALAAYVRELARPEGDTETAIQAAQEASPRLLARARQLDALSADYIVQQLLADAAQEATHAERERADAHREDHDDDETIAELRAALAPLARFADAFERLRGIDTEMYTIAAIDPPAALRYEDARHARELLSRTAPDDDQAAP